MSNAVVTDWPSGSANTGWPQEPSAMLMPGMVQGWPAGTQRAANAAERLLSQAVAWWDVEQYRDGDRFLRNRGVAGELLDLRLGSSIAPNSNDPLYLAPEDQGYVYLPWVAGNYLSVPDENALDITGDIDVRVQVAFASPTTTTDALVTKWASGNQSWAFQKNSQDLSGGGDYLRFVWTTNGSTTIGATSTVPLGVSSGQTVWVRVTLDVDNGAGTPQYEVKFYTSTDNAVTWTQLGSTVTGSTGPTSIYSGTAGVRVGSRELADLLSIARYYRAIVKDGIDGTTVLDIDCDAITSGSATSFTASTNQTVTVNRSTSGRKSVCVPSRHKGGRPVMLLGTDDYLEIPAGNGWQHALLNFDTGQAYTILWVGRQWTGTVAFSARFTKGGANNQGPGWVLSCLESTGRMGFYLGPSGSVYLQSEATPSPAFGPVVVATAVRNGFINGLRLTVNAATGTNSSTLTGQETASTSSQTRIGTTSTVTHIGNFEWYAAAVWRRALTNAEVTSLNSYFTGRIA